MALTGFECIGYAMLYAYMGLGTGYWLRRVVESLKSKEVRK